MITVFTSPPVKWNEKTIFNLINGHLGNVKRQVRVTSVASDSGALTFTMDVPFNNEDLNVFKSPFKSQLEKHKDADMVLRVEVQVLP